MPTQPNQPANSSSPLDRSGIHVALTSTQRVDPSEVFCSTASDPEKCEQFAEKLRMQQVVLRRLS